ncbi:F-box protein [Prunus yedoensis var. nudiflora]|uniref:F-box protein n=1 Tax=Prunus yedoensis var. nudiflora TaxID=2094558 RepID=A0A314YT43_PRUYE|nr:F-box protein [Prunus yedoensis var. nudiflora]
MSSESCGSSLLLALSDDVFSIVTWSLSPRDIGNLSLCCRSLYALMESEKVWQIQCEMVGIVPLKTLFSGNPELGNVVYVMPGFVSVVGCRIIPQELGPLGIEDGPILWAPVFEIIGDFDGSTSFFLHGREKGQDYVYPGFVKSIGSKSFVHHSDEELSRKICRSNSGLSRSQRVFGQSETLVPFSRLAFSDRRKLLDVITSQSRLKVPDAAVGPLFPRLRDNEENFQKDLVLLLERRSMLYQMHKLGGGHMDSKASSLLPSDPSQLQLSEIRKSLDRLSGSQNSINEDNGHRQCNRRKTLSKYFRDSLNQIFGKSIATNANSKNGSSSSENKHASLEDFLSSGDTIGLTLHASHVKLSSYRAWPNMHDSRFAIYRLPLRIPTAEQEYAGLWGGTFGWPPGKSSKDKPGKALFFLLLSYEESGATTSNCNQNIRGYPLCSAS